MHEENWGSHAQLESLTHLMHYTKSKAIPGDENRLFYNVYLGAIHSKISIPMKLAVMKET